MNQVAQYVTNTRTRAFRSSMGIRLCTELDYSWHCVAGLVSAPNLYCACRFGLAHIPCPAATRELWQFQKRLPALNPCLANLGIMRSPQLGQIGESILSSHSNRSDRSCSRCHSLPSRLPTWCTYPHSGQATLRRYRSHLSNVIQSLPLVSICATLQFPPAARTFPLPHRSNDSTHVGLPAEYKSLKKRGLITCVGK